MSLIHRYLKGIAGRYFGFYDAIEKNTIRICRLEHDIDTMHAYYMGKYRELEREVVGSRNAPMEIKVYNTQPGREHTFAIAHCAMSDMDMCAKPAVHAQHETIVMADLRIGFIIDPENRRGDEATVHQVAVAFARKAADLAYDETMKRYGHRLEPFYNSAGQQRAR